MNAMQHARISAKRWGGEPEDYYEIHAFIDSTKSLCSDARHRVLHTLWGINSVVVPIFGHSLVTSTGKSVDVKDLCERDHLLVDYQQRFIPTLHDFVNAIDVKQLPQNFEQHLEQLHLNYVKDKTLSQMMLSPLAQTGKLHSLLLTHNSWFILISYLDWDHCLVWEIFVIALLIFLMRCILNCGWTMGWQFL